MDDLIAEFLSETAEGLAALDVELVRLERSPDDPELIGGIFRIVHTIKGTCGFLGLERLERLAHSAENVLGKFRDRDLPVTADSVTLILSTLDRLKMIVAGLEATGSEPEGNDAALIAELDAAAEGGLGHDAGAAASEDPEPVANGSESEIDLAQTPAPVAAVGPDGEAVEEIPPASVPAEAAQPREIAAANQSIRVSVDLLENLMTMVGELVLTRNQLLQMLRRHEDSEFAAPLQRLNQITSELQDGVMKTRMQPIGNAWAKMPRIVRDIAGELGKRIQIEMFGAETELDRQVLELIKDPLTHMIRNACDHGLEAPAERTAAGKPEEGRLVLRAFHEGGHIIVRITDDGRGLPTRKIRDKALALGFATEAELAEMPDHVVHQFIFKPGFSTASQVTNVSGRGVGMDVVRANIERIGGTIELGSTEGAGTIVTIKIPLTLAIVSSLIVESADERFAIPQISVRELVRVSDQSETRIEHIDDASILRLRERILPLVRLDRLLGLRRADDESGNRDDGFVVVTEVGSHRFGILVDRVFDSEEIVVKPVAPVLRDVKAFSGNTILGDGSVVMILDPNGIAAMGGRADEADGRETAVQPARSRHKGNECTALLLFRAGSGAPKAVPLGLVARLEEVPVEKIETSDAHPVVQYRGGLMPLITVDPMQMLNETGNQPVVVFTDRDRTMGLVVDEILDIVEDRLVYDTGPAGEGLIASTVVAGQAVDVVDVGHYLQRAFSDWFGAHEDRRSRSVLVVDDSAFFRHMLAPLLSRAGYDVTTVDGAEEALELKAEGRRFDLIVSDIDMPDTDGFAFAEAVRESDEWRETPLVALSGRSSARDVERGRAAGFTDYVGKFERDSLLQAMSQALSISRGAA